MFLAICFIRHWDWNMHLKERKLFDQKKIINFLVVKKLSNRTLFLKLVFTDFLRSDMIQKLHSESIYGD